VLPFGKQLTQQLGHRMAGVFNYQRHAVQMAEAVGNNEREPQDGPKLKFEFEAVAQMDAEERAAVDSLLDAMILKQQNKRFL
jgi:hypothetical protein